MLTALGVTQRATSHRVLRGRLHRLHSGVFAVGLLAGEVPVEAAASRPAPRWPGWPRAIAARAG